MRTNILVTYKHIEGYFTYDWFESLEEVKYFIANSSIIKYMVDCCDCSNATEINL